MVFNWVKILMISTLLITSVASVAQIGDILYKRSKKGKEREEKLANITGFATGRGLEFEAELIKRGGEDENIDAYIKAHKKK